MASDGGYDMLVIDPMPPRIDALSVVLLSRTILGRLARITETAKAVRSGELSRRAPSMGTRDEFDRFCRVEEGRSSPGNGIGLSLVRSICSLHGFTIQLRPNAPGTTFEEVP